MGYKSDVAAVVTNDDFMALIRTAREKNQSAYELLADATIRQKGLC